MYAEHEIKMSPREIWLLLFALLILPSATAQEYKAKSASVPAPKKVTATLAARALAPPNSQAELADREKRLEEHYRPGPLQKLSAAARLAALPPTVAATSVTAPAAAAVLRLNSNQPIPGTATSGMTSHVDEPSVAVRGQEILFTGNWYAAFSTNGGTTFSYMNPAMTFPPIPNQPWCCDQVALYDARHDLMFWFNQYVEDSNGNTGRLAVAHGNDIASQQWRYYDFTPQSVGGWTNEWFDFPDLAVGDKYLYITTNVFKTQTNQFTRAVILRIPLDKLQGYQGLNYDHFDTTQDFSLRPTQGATDTMYFANHVSEDTLRVFTWPENSTTIGSATATVQAWSDATRSAPGPDGKDWLGRADSRITAAWRSGNTIGFAWTAARDSNFALPHVRVAVLDKNTKAVVSQPHLWNSGFAYAYPAVAVNSDGRVAISVAFGGGALFPSHAVGVLDTSNSTWELVTTANGTNGPSSNRWGDYLAARSHGRDPQTWVATGFTLQGGTAQTNVEPRYIQFSLGPPPLKITLVNPTPSKRLKNGETATLQAKVTMNGSAVAGKTVNFQSADPTKLVVVTPSAVTDTQGVAPVTVRGATSSRATITVTAEVPGEGKGTTTVLVPDLSLDSFIVLLAVLLLALLLAESRKRRCRPKSAMGGP